MSFEARIETISLAGYPFGNAQRHSRTKLLWIDCRFRDFDAFVDEEGWNNGKPR